MTANGISATSPQTRVEALRRKHAALKSRIEEAHATPSTTDFYLRQLKKQKLMLKEEIEKIRTTN
ncbi:MAG: YdcH family protein [Alphaproteobacteria bacterium]